MRSLGGLLFSLLLLVARGGYATLSPEVPTDLSNPGSKVYPYGVSETTLECHDRSIVLFIPVATHGEKFPVVAYGHGQALGVDKYRGTFVHLARKGVAVIFPNYDKNFFDQDWRRMGHDYMALVECALQENRAVMNAEAVVYSGHSKGAYIAGIAAGFAGLEHPVGAPRAVVLFESAGFDGEAISHINPNSSLTVVYGQDDGVVSRDLSEETYRASPAKVSQFILVKSYPNPKFKADHFWPLTEGSLFGGGVESALHYYGAWKWLVAAAQDLTTHAPFQNPYLYGNMTGEKGVTDLHDEIRRK